MTRSLLPRLPRSDCGALLIATALAFPFRAVQAQEHQHPAGDRQKLGTVEFPVSCAPVAAARFGPAVAMLHSFWFEAAEKEFRSILAAYPECGAAHWGLSMTLMGNPMTRVASTVGPEAALAAARQAKLLTAKATHREQMYAEAALAYWGEPAGRSHLERMAALERSFDALYRAHPEDREAAIFYARTLVANADPKDATYAKQLQAAAIMEPLFEKYEDHPGLAHYLIHAYDAPALAGKGEAAARVYAGIAPSAPHALHMPSHIFTRRGQWDESIETNIRSARAEPDSNAAVHPMDYMVYAYLQQGRDTAAGRVVKRVVEAPDRYYAGVTGYNYAAMPARYALEREQWQEAAALAAPPPSMPPFMAAVTHFARGIGAARSGAAAQAEAEASELARLEQKLRAAGDAEWAARVGAQRLAVAAWAARARGDDGQALELAHDAAELEETIEKHPVTPGPLLPARELEGDLLLELGRFAEAKVAYVKTLEREPRRARALAGAARAAERADDVEAARRYYTELVALMAGGDGTRPQLVAARQYLAR